MNILSWDTSGPLLSIAFYQQGKPLVQHNDSTDQRHSTELIPQINRVLTRAKKKLKDVDVIAVGLGPGSFTGLRVGLATAKTLAYASQKPLIGVDSLRARAFASAQEGERIAVLLDARRGNVYGAFYERQKEGVKEIIAPTLISIDSILKKIKKADRVVGAAASVYHNKINEVLGRSSSVHIEAQEVGLAAAIAQLAYPRALRKRTDNLFKIKPLYLHPRDCNVTPRVKR